MTSLSDRHQENDASSRACKYARARVNTHGISWKGFLRGGSGNVTGLIGGSNFQLRFIAMN